MFPVVVDEVSPDEAADSDVAMLLVVSSRSMSRLSRTMPACGVHGACSSCRRCARGVAFGPVERVKLAWRFLLVRASWRRGLRRQARKNSPSASCGTCRAVAGAWRCFMLYGELSAELEGHPLEVVFQQHGWVRRSWEPQRRRRRRGHAASTGGCSTKRRVGWRRRQGLTGVSGCRSTPASGGGPRWRGPRHCISGTPAAMSRPGGRTSWGMMRRSRPRWWPSRMPGRGGWGRRLVLGNTRAGGRVLARRRGARRVLQLPHGGQAGGGCAPGRLACARLIAPRGSKGAWSTGMWEEGIESAQPILVPAATQVMLHEHPVRPDTTADFVGRRICDNWSPRHGVPRLRRLGRRGAAAVVPRRGL